MNLRLEGIAKKSFEEFETYKMKCEQKIKDLVQFSHQRTLQFENEKSTLREELAKETNLRHESKRLKNKADECVNELLNVTCELRQKLSESECMNPQLRTLEETTQDDTTKPPKDLQPKKITKVKPRRGKKLNKKQRKSGSSPVKRGNRSFVKLKRGNGPTSLMAQTRQPISVSIRAAEKKPRTDSTAGTSKSNLNGGQGDEQPHHFKNMSALLKSLQCDVQRLQKDYKLALDEPESAAPARGKAKGDVDGRKQEEKIKSIIKKLNLKSQELSALKHMNERMEALNSLQKYSSED